MDRKDVYLWGTLLALVREQLDAIDKQIRGRLGIWGKSRFQSRNKEVQKFLFQLYQRKTQTHGDQAVQALLSDLELIENDKHTWSDVAPQELKYVRNMLESLD